MKRNWKPVRNKSIHMSIHVLTLCLSCWFAGRTVHEASSEWLADRASITAKANITLVHIEKTALSPHAHCMGLPKRQLPKQLTC